MKLTCDLCDEFGDSLRVLPSGLISFGGTPHFHGRAETVRCFEDNSRIRELAHSTGLGRLMMIDAAASLRTAVMGDMIAAAALANGWAGAVIWGAVRDRAQLRGVALGIMALGCTPRRPRKRNEGQAGIAIEMGDVPVAPGDYVVADEDGVVILAAGGPLPDGATP